MSHRFIRLPEVIRITGKSRSGIYADVAIGAFPKPYRIGKRTVAWLEGDIQDWIEQRVQAAIPKTT